MDDTDKKDRLDALITLLVDHGVPPAIADVLMAVGARVIDSLIMLPDLIETAIQKNEAQQIQSLVGAATMLTELDTYAMLARPLLEAVRGTVEDMQARGEADDTGVHADGAQDLTA